MEAMMNISLVWLLAVYPWCQRGNVLCPLLIFDCFFFPNVICSNSSCEPFISSLCDVCLMRMSWLLDSETAFAFDVQFLFLVPIFGHSECRKLSPAAPFPTFLLMLPGTYLLCPASDTAKLFRNDYDKGRDYQNICSLISPCFRNSRITWECMLRKHTSYAKRSRASDVSRLMINYHNN